MRRLGWLVVVAALSVAPACHRVFKGKVSQPNPLSNPTETLRDSEPIIIVTGDMELQVPEPASGPADASLRRMQKYPLINKASFTVVSRDRLRFHVQLEHKWQEYADLENWQAWIIIDKGRRYLPESVEAGEAEHVVTMWDREIRSVRRNRFGDIVTIYNDGYKDRQPLGSLSVFRGRGDYVFYSRDIFTPDVKRVTLVVERRGMAFTFTWRFEEDGPPGGVSDEASPMAAR